MILIFLLIFVPGFRRGRQFVQSRLKLLLTYKYGLRGFLFSYCVTQNSWFSQLNLTKELLVALQRTLNADLLIVEWTDALREANLKRNWVLIAPLVHIIFNPLGKSNHQRLGTACSVGALRVACVHYSWNVTAFIINISVVIRWVKVGLHVLQVGWVFVTTAVPANSQTWFYRQLVPFLY